MIDPKTLHIGSHVMVDGVRARVIRIDEPKDEHEIPPCTLLRVKAFVNGKWHDCGGSADSDKIEPIPITEELLHQIGFEDKVDCGIKIFQKKFGDYAVRFIYDGDNLWRCNCYADNNLMCRVGMVRRIIYLHQAEQMLSVCGVELIKEQDMETNTNTTPRRRIEDMTLGEIKALKTRLEDRIGEAICVAVENFQRAYDLGYVDLRVETDIQRFRDMSGVEVADPTIKYNVNVKFTDAEL